MRDSLDNEGIEQRTAPVSNAGSTDGPAAAMVARVVNGNTELWVFACGEDHVMRRCVQTAGGNCDRWFTVANSFACYSTPTIGKWIGGTPSEAMGVYYRGGNKNVSPAVTDHLIEAWYRNDGTTVATDLSAIVPTGSSFPNGFGSIVGSPAVADAVDRPGMSQRISVAVKRPNNEVFTFDYYQSAWHIQPATMGDGSTVVAAASDDFGVSYGQYSRNYLSTEVLPGTFAVLSRSTWTRGYSFSGSLTDPDLGGVMTFGRPDPACLTNGCTMSHKVSNLSMVWHSLTPGSSVNGKIELSLAVTGPLYSAPTGDNTHAVYINVGNTFTDSIAMFDFPNLGTPSGNKSIQKTRVSSGGMPVVNGASSGPTAATAYAFRDATDPPTVHRLYFIRFDDIYTVDPRDLNYPGNVLIP